MKIRTDFVTNSSSSSFITVKITNKKLIDIIMKNGFTIHEDAEITNDTIYIHDDITPLSRMLEYRFNIENELGFVLDVDDQRLQEIIEESSLYEQREIVYEAGGGGSEWDGEDDLGLFCAKGKFCRWKNENLEYYCACSSEDEEDYYLKYDHGKVYLRDIENIIWDNESVYKALKWNEENYELAELCCSEFSELRIPKNITMINNSSVFDGTDNLETIIIEGSFEESEEDDFTPLECFPDKLINIYVSEDNCSYLSLDGVLFSKDMKKLLRFPTGRSGEYIIPDGVEEISMSAFSNSSLSDVFIPDSVKNIGRFAFSGCSKLSKIVFPENVNEIGDDALSYCEKLQTIVIKNQNILPDNILSDYNNVTIYAPIGSESEKFCNEIIKDGYYNLCYKNITEYSS